MRPITTYAGETRHITLIQKNYLEQSNIKTNILVSGKARLKMEKQVQRDIEEFLLKNYKVLNIKLTKILIIYY